MGGNKTMKNTVGGKASSFCERFFLLTLIMAKFFNRLFYVAYVFLLSTFYNKSKYDSSLIQWVIQPFIFCKI